MTWTILASVNLVCAVFSYSLLAYALACLRWRGRGIFFVLLAIFLCGQIWMVPQSIASFCIRWNIVLYPIWLGNWLISAFSIVLFSQSLRTTSRDLADAARMDGCGVLGIYWHVILPLVRQSLLLIAILTAVATLIELAARFGRLTSSFEIAGPSGIDIRLLIVGSLIMAVPLIAIFFYARRCSWSR